MENNPKDEQILSHIDHVLEDQNMALQDEFERHERWLLERGDIDEMQYNIAVTEYRKSFQAPIKEAE